MWALEALSEQLSLVRRGARTLSLQGLNSLTGSTDKSQYMRMRRDGSQDFLTIDNCCFRFFFGRREGRTGSRNVSRYSANLPFCALHASDDCLLSHSSQSASHVLSSPQAHTEKFTIISYIQVERSLLVTLFAIYFVVSASSLVV